MYRTLEQAPWKDVAGSASYHALWVYNMGDVFSALGRLQDSARHLLKGTL